MILSVSRRTDIPAFYSEWFFNRINEGFVLVRNPMNVHQVSRIKITPELVDCIVFWTKNAMPMLDRLDELKDYMYYFQYTINPYDKTIEQRVSEKTPIINSFKKISDKIGNDRVIWRYDPILITDVYDVNYHIRYFKEIAQRIQSYTNTCVISFVDLYKKTIRNLKGIEVREPNVSEMIELSSKLLQIAQSYGMKIQTCSEAIDLDRLGIPHGKCIDEKLIEHLIGWPLDVSKDKNQRKECGCVQSIDIGEYNTCDHNCLYCYANFNREKVVFKRKKHDPLSPMIIGNVESDDKITDRKVYSLKGDKTLF